MTVTHKILDIHISWTEITNYRVP